MNPLILLESDKLLWERLKAIPHDAVCVTRTDTIYGLGCRYDSVRARERILNIKQRTETKFIVLVNSLEKAKSICEITTEQESVLSKYWPGPISFVLKNKSENPDQPTLALRFPQLPFLHQLIELMGGTMVSTSCNLTGSAPVLEVPEAIKLFGDKVDFYVDSGVMATAKPSTLVDLTSNPPQVLRAGALTFP